jgi:hypothetical protein
MSQGPAPGQNAASHGRPLQAVLAGFGLRCCLYRLFDWLCDFNGKVAHLLNECGKGDV